MKSTDQRCYNCKYASGSFKVRKLTHHHCMSPKYEKQQKEGVVISPWETLRLFSDTCDEHEFKKKREPNEVEIRKNEFLKKYGIYEGDTIEYAGNQVTHKAVVVAVQFLREHPIGLIVSLLDKNLKSRGEQRLILQNEIKGAILLSKP
jgi:hypothetical protein